MKKYIVLYNPLSGKIADGNVKQELEAILDGTESELYNVTEIENMREFLSRDAESNILLVGGDGTLNRFINDIDTDALPNDIYYYAGGNGNDFWTDIGFKRGDPPVCINKYLKNLPIVTVNGKDYKFINGVGFGIDGYCCEEGDRLKALGKKVNYTGIAVKGLLFKFAPVNAAVTVDGETHEFKKVWIAPTMFGRYYGGGMIAAPEQDRNADKPGVSVCLFYGKGRLKTLTVFPSIFKGEHVKHTETVIILKGTESVTVKFDRPAALQIDGETVSCVSEYTVKCS